MTFCVLDAKEQLNGIKLTFNWANVQNVHFMGLINLKYASALDKTISTRMGRPGNVQCAFQKNLNG